MKYVDRFDDDDVMEEEGKDTVFLFSVRKYTAEEKVVLLERCVTLLSNCIVGPNLENKDVFAVYDVLYSNYCKKFEVKERLTEAEILPNFESEFYMIEESMKRYQLEAKDMWYSLKVIAVVVSAVGVILYYLGVYLVKFETEDI